MKQYLGKRVLFSVGDNDAVRSSCVRLISPNGKFALIGGDLPMDEEVGWQRIEDVRVLDVIGDERQTMQEITRLAFAKLG